VTIGVSVGAWVGGAVTIGVSVGRLGRRRGHDRVAVSPWNDSYGVCDGAGEEQEPPLHVAESVLLWSEAQRT